jgi:hypothetical protein
MTDKDTLTLLFFSFVALNVLEIKRDFLRRMETFEKVYNTKSWTSFIERIAESFAGLSEKLFWFVRQT